MFVFNMGLTLRMTFDACTGTVDNDISELLQCLRLECLSIHRAKHVLVCMYAECACLVCIHRSDTT